MGSVTGGIAAVLGAAPRRRPGWCRLVVEPDTVSPSPLAAAAPAAVLFDMDGTLVDSEKLWTISLDAYAAHRGGVLSPSAHAAMLGSNMNRSMGVLLDDLGLPSAAEDVAAAARWVESRTAELFRQGLEWRPGARQLLRGVRAGGLPTALVTSTNRALLEIALDTLGRDSFDVTVGGDEVDGRNKPDPEPYSRACGLLGVDPGGCVAVEDSPTGMASAEAAGCLVVGVPCETSLEAGERRAVHDSLEQLDVEALAELVNAG